MTSAIALSLGLLLLADSASAQGAKPLKKCPADAVVSGTVCMDRYEVSVWRVPDPLGANKSLVSKLRQGRATVDDLTAGGATPLGQTADDYAPCDDAGQTCANDVFAASLPGVTPSASITWFQAQQACKNARKRLPTNAEWQAAVAGTPAKPTDNGTTDCNTESTLAVSLTGARSACVSSDGAFDMVGNLFEWVADWVPRSTGCSAWSPSVDTIGVLQCVTGAATSGAPGVLVRGGNFAYDYSIGANGAGPLTIAGWDPPSLASNLVGFRCAR